MAHTHVNTRAGEAGQTTPKSQAKVVWLLCAIAWLVAASASAQPALSTNAPGAAPLPGSGSIVFSFFRVFGALAIVFAVFLAGLWLFRNWQRVLVRKGRPARFSAFFAGADL